MKKWGKISSVAFAGVLVLTACSGAQVSPQSSQQVVEDFADCIASPYRSDYRPKLVVLVSETGEIFDLSNDAIDELKEQVEDYQVLGDSFKFADDCGDAKFGDLNTELGDTLVEVGESIAAINKREIAAGDYSSIDRFVTNFARASRQSRVIDDYLLSR